MHRSVEIEDTPVRLHPIGMHPYRMQKEEKTAFFYRARHLYEMSAGN
ncbi:MAG: hypothetical protein LBG77_03375 [Dysgonamonadaceae bacterium]|nr:hypothetical protein [Dysgonamonadaceae bacterium]